MLFAATVMTASAQVQMPKLASVQKEFGKVAVSVQKADDNTGGFVSEPKGERKVYTGSGNFIVYRTSELSYLNYDLYFDGNDVYIKCLFSGAVYPLDNYIKATKEGDKLLIPVGGHYMDYNGARLAVSQLKITEEGKAVLDSTATSIVLTIKGDTLVEDDPNTMMGLTVMEDYYYPDEPDYPVYTKGEALYKIDKLTLVPFTEEAPAFPDGADVKMAHFYSNDIFDELEMNWMGKVARVGNDIYVQGFHRTEPQLMMKGTVKDNKVIFPSPQYIGVDWRGYHSFNYTTHLDETTYTFALDSTDFVMDYDEEAEIMKTDQWALYTAGTAPQFFVLAPEIYSFEMTPAKPATPVFQHFQNYDYSWANYYSFVYDIPMTDVDGNFINPDSITYCLYENDEVKTFTPEEYKIDETMTEIPYYFNNSSDIVYTEADNLTRHFVNFYDKTITKCGVQSFYTAQGIKTASDILWCDVSTALGIQGNVADSNAVSHEYFDMSGRRIAAPRKGITLHKVTFADGSSKTYKELK